MIKDKLLLTKVTKSILSSSFVSIVISMCLLVNLFTPGLSTVVQNKSSTVSSEYHTCGCITGVHSLSLCCCGEKADTSGTKCLPERDSGNAFTSFIQSLACAGVPDQFTPISYNARLPEEGISSPGLSLLYHMEQLRTICSASIKVPPPYKPPRII
ncbi:MAG: hypothetical protein NUV86_03620 [Candidatus Scalindua sp.]|nr:hypothetical protein [Candidatus Scalindua sp.]MCR4344995.1 hypothetical protein [Candidatus Scalindua sp.]